MRRSLNRAHFRQDPQPAQDGRTGILPLRAVHGSRRRSIADERQACLRVEHVNVAAVNRDFNRVADAWRSSTRQQRRHVDAADLEGGQRLIAEEFDQVDPAAQASCVAARRTPMEVSGPQPDHHRRAVVDGKALGRTTERCLAAPEQRFRRLATGRHFQEVDRRRPDKRRGELRARPIEYLARRPHLLDPAVLEQHIRSASVIASS